MDTKIYSVFPACGKTWMCEQQENYNLKILDSDSSQFSWMVKEVEDADYALIGEGEIKPLIHKKKVRNPDFPKNYIEHIKNNIGKYDCIFVSSHASVREALDKEGINFTIVYPRLGCKDEWVGRCFSREKNGENGCSAEIMYNNWGQWISECEGVGRTHDEIVLKAREYLSDYFIRYCGNRKVVGMRAVNVVDFETPITQDEWQKLHHELVPRIDDVIYDLGYVKGWGVCAPIYEGDED